MVLNLSRMHSEDDKYKYIKFIFPNILLDNILFWKNFVLPLKEIHLVHSCVEGIMPRFRSSLPEVFCNFIKKETLVQLFSCEFCEVFKNIFFTEHLRWMLLLDWDILSIKKHFEKSDLNANDTYFCSSYIFGLIFWN